MKGTSVIGFIGMLAVAASAAHSDSSEARPSGKPAIRKLGTIDCDMVETTPVVWRGKLYRFEYVRDNYKPNKTGASYFRFVDVATGAATAPFAPGWHLGSAYVEPAQPGDVGAGKGDRAYVFGVNIWNGAEIRVFWSDDLARWSSKTALDLPGWGIYNTSVCKGADGYVMAFEIGEPPEETGAPYTMRFAKSEDLLHWRLTPSDCVFSKDRYTACPALRFLDGMYYMIYLEAKPGPTYEPYVVRSKDLVHWESSPYNPVMQFSQEDKIIANPRLTDEQPKRIADAANLNNSDVDLCEFEATGPPYILDGRKRPVVVINYSWGNQQGIEFLAEAVYDGTLADFLRGWFPEH